MSKSMRVLVGGGIVVAVASIIYYQLQFYRSPVAVNQTRTGPVIVEALNSGSIPAINEPAFESVPEADVYLNNEGLGIAVASGNRARFYPFQILVWHEVVNDTFGGRKMLVSYSPLTATANVFDRSMNGVGVNFEASGWVADSNTLLIDDATQSLWMQATGKAMDGSSKGKALERIVSWTISWSTFKEEFPRGEVLSRETGVDRDYTQDPYENAGYPSSSAIWFPLSRTDATHSAKDLVVGLPGGARVYPIDGPYGDGIEWDEDLDAPRAFTITQEGDRVEVPVLVGYWFYWATLL